MTQPLLPYADSLAILTKLAQAHKSRKDFNEAVERHFKPLGRGDFRFVVESLCHKYVIKLRHDTKAINEGGFTHEEVTSSNLNESWAFKLIKKDAPHCAQFILEPTRHVLPNHHDIVTMRRVDVLGQTDGQCYDTAHPIVIEQMQLLSDLFDDVHADNVGYVGDLKTATCCIYMIDLNLVLAKEVERTIANDLRARDLLHRLQKET